MVVSKPYIKIKFYCLKWFIYRRAVNFSLTFSCVLKINQNLRGISAIICRIERLSGIPYAGFFTKCATLKLDLTKGAAHLK